MSEKYFFDPNKEIPYYVNNVKTTIDNKYFQQILNDIFENVHEDCFGILALKEIAESYKNHIKYISNTTEFDIITDKYYVNSGYVFTLNDWLHPDENDEDLNQTIEDILDIESDGYMRIYAATATEYYRNISLTDGIIQRDISDLPKQIADKITHVYVEVSGK